MLKTALLGLALLCIFNAMYAAFADSPPVPPSQAQHARMVATAYNATHPISLEMIALRPKHAETVICTHHGDTTVCGRTTEPPVLAWDAGKHKFVPVSGERLQKILARK